MRIAILGCGPAGLLAAYAAEQLGERDVSIISRKRQSQLYGCQYLHEPIVESKRALDGPGFCVLAGVPANLEYILEGSAEDYARKVYGRIPPPVVSPQLFQGWHFAWDLRAAYEKLWQRFNQDVTDVVVKPHNVAEIIAEYDVVLSTIPAPYLCQKANEHEFTKTVCWAMGDSEHQTVPIRPAPFTVVCDGRPETSYYRASNVFGAVTVEWPGHRRKPPISGVVPFEKPLNTTCDCWPHIKRIGRYGRWKKGVLAHTAYRESLEHLRRAQDIYG